MARFSRSLIALSATAASALLLAGCASGAQPEAPTGATHAASGDCAGVRVIVDFASLGADDLDTCVDVSSETAAPDIAKQAGLTFEGTTAHGDLIICRVNGEPQTTDKVKTATGFYTEDCADMPSADAYWSLWVKQDGTWDYAQVGASDLKLTPGQSVALVYNENNSVTALSY